MFRPLLELFGIRPWIKGKPDTPRRWLNDLADTIEAARGTNLRAVEATLEWANFTYWAPRMGLSWQAIRGMMREVGEAHRQAAVKHGPLLPEIVLDSRGRYRTKDAGEMVDDWPQTPFSPLVTYHHQLSSLLLVLRDVAEEAR